MKKALTVILIAALALTSPIFAGGAKEEGPAEVYYLNFKPEIAEVYTNEVIPAFEEATGIPLKVVTAASNQYEPTLRSEITKSEPPVIFQVNGPVGLQTWKDYAAPLEDTSFYGMLSDKSMALSADGHVLAIPYTVEGYGIIYNDAIMRAYFALPDKAVSISSAEEINSFETLKAVVEDMTKHIVLVNTGENDCYVRIKVFCGSRFTINYSSAADDKGEPYWNLNESDGYWYYRDIVPAGEKTEELLAEIEVPEGFTESFDIVVIQECTPVLYGEDGTAGAWEDQPGAGCAGQERKRLPRRADGDADGVSV